MSDSRAVLCARSLRIEGKVQGVGFRWFFSGQARRLDVSGWVRNVSDGTVIAEVAGEQENVARLIAWASHGPEQARVSAVHVEDLGEAMAQQLRSEFALFVQKRAVLHLEG